MSLKGKETRTRFRPCIDLHEGKVKQIVGGTLSDENRDGPVVNFETNRSPAWFAQRYQKDGLEGGHVIKLGPGNSEAARSALAAYPGGLQIGGGITSENASAWLEEGGSHVIVTSFLFNQDGRFLQERLDEIVSEIGKDHLVIDLSCRRDEEGWVVAMNRWQTPTVLRLETDTLDFLSNYCCEFLVHAADVEGKCQGIDGDLVRRLGEWGKCPVTYAGGAQSLADLKEVDRLSGGRVDLTIGSALDLFGGNRIRYADCVAFNQSPQN